MTQTFRKPPSYAAAIETTVSRLARHSESNASRKGLWLRLGALEGHGPILPRDYGPGACARKIATTVLCFTDHACARTTVFLRCVVSCACALKIAFSAGNQTVRAQGQ